GVSRGTRSRRSRRHSPRACSSKETCGGWKRRPRDGTRKAIRRVPRSLDSFPRSSSTLRTAPCRASIDRMGLSLYWKNELKNVLAGCPVETDSEILASFSRDQAPLAPAGTPAVLVRACSVDDVVRTLRYANEQRIPVVTRAAGTGLAGGANA